MTELLETDLEQHQDEDGEFLDELLKQKSAFIRQTCLTIQSNQSRFKWEQEIMVFQWQIWSFKLDLRLNRCKN